MTTLIELTVIASADPPSNPTKMTLAEFLASHEADERYEFIDGQLVEKVSPKRFHAALQGALYRYLIDLFEGKGFVYPEWGIILTRNGQDWCPVPDLTYISLERLPSDVGNEMCPVAPELTIEIMSEGQTFGGFVAKAGDYLNAGVLRVWIVDLDHRSITIFYGDRPPETYRNGTLITDELFPDLVVTIEQLFANAGV